MSKPKPLSNEEYLEQRLIGTLLIVPELYPEISVLVRAEDFLGIQARSCWSIIADRFGKIDNSQMMGTVYTTLTAPGEKQWMIEATEQIIPTPSEMPALARRIADLARLRRIKSSLGEISTQAAAGTENSKTILERVMEVCRKESGAVDDRDARIVPVVARFKAKQQEHRERGCLGLSTGWDLFQRKMIHFEEGHLWVIGGWTSVGKTAWMVESLKRFMVANPDAPVRVFSTEMTETQVVARILANMTGVNSKVILSGMLLDMHQRMVDEQTEWLSKQNLEIHDRVNQSDEIIAHCRRAKYSGGLSLAIVDFIQNVSKPGFQSDYAMMSQIAKDFQNAAIDLRCTIMCLSQIPNQEARDDSGVLVYKGAGEIAAAADIGIVLKRAREDKSQLLVDMRKNRHGPVGKFVKKFNNSWTSIEEVAEVE